MVCISECVPSLHFCPKVLDGSNIIYRTDAHSPHISFVHLNWFNLFTGRSYRMKLCTMFRWIVVKVGTKQNIIASHEMKSRFWILLLSFLFTSYIFVYFVSIPIFTFALERLFVPQMFCVVCPNSRFTAHLFCWKNALRIFVLFFRLSNNWHTIKT